MNESLNFAAALAGVFLVGMAAGYLLRSLKYLFDGLQEVLNYRRHTNATAAALEDATALNGRAGWSLDQVAAHLAWLEAELKKVKYTNCLTGDVLREARRNPYSYDPESPTRIPVDSRKDA